MAVDTASKRMSAMNFGDGSTVHLLPEPDGMVDDDDKQHLLDLYNGFDMVTFKPFWFRRFILGQG